MKQFGKPWTCIPCSVRMPSAHFSVRLWPPASVELEAGATRVVGADLEAAGVDQAVQLVLVTVHHDALLRDALHALPLGVDERDVRAVEGLEVLVVEAGTLAELAVVGLEGLRGLGILDDGVHPRADLLHLLEVRDLDGLLDALGRESLDVPCWMPTRSLAMRSVQPSFTRSSGCGTPETRR